MRFATLNTAVSGMNVAQANLFVTGHNMANVNVPGFTRQQVVQADHFSQSAGRNHTGTMQVGLGANVQTIRQLRDRFLDLAFRQSAGTMAFNNVSYNAGRAVELTIGELEGEYKLQSVLRDLKNYIHELHNNMPGVETRGEFISAAISFVDKSNDIFNSLIRQQNNLNDNIKVMTRRINELVDIINTYSQKIRMNEFTGDNANDFRDVVNRALDELASYIDITYSIRPGFNVTIHSEGHTLLANNIQTKLGLRFASKNTNLVEVVISRYEGIHQYEDNVRTFFDYRRNIDPRAGNDSGALKGLIAARGFNHYTFADSPQMLETRHQNMLAALARVLGNALTAAGEDVLNILTPLLGMLADVPDVEASLQNAIANIGNMTDAQFTATLTGMIATLNTHNTDPAHPRFGDLGGVIAGLEAALTAFAAGAEQRDEIRRENEQEVRLVNLQFQRDMFSMNNSIIAQAQLQVDTMVNTIVRMINDTLAPRVRYDNGYNEDGLANHLNPEHPNFNRYRMRREGDPPCERFPFVWGNEDDPRYGTGMGPPYGQDGSQYFIPIFVRRSEDFRADRYTGQMQGENVHGTGPFCEDTLGLDPYFRSSLFTMGNFVLNPVLRTQAGYKYMTLSISGDAEDQRLLAHLLAQWDSDSVGIDDGRRLSVEEFYRRMVGNLGVNIERFRSISESEAEVLNATENARLSMSGVALDEEMANMLRFQHAFHGASRLFNYIDSMLDTLINRTGRVGL